MIVVNGREFTTRRRFLTYEELLGLAGFKKDRQMTVTYRSCRTLYAAYNAGTVIAKERVLVRDGMIFNVADTSGT